MGLSLYEVIRGPIFSEKATTLVNKFKKIVLEVHPHANKPMIADALEKLFNVKVESIRTIVRKGKVRSIGRHETRGKTTKRAIITLKEGYSLDMAQQAGADIAAETSSVVAGEV
jgi:large subunit ribosomal protein L23